MIIYTYIYIYILYYSILYYIILYLYLYLYLYIIFVTGIPHASAKEAATEPEPAAVPAEAAAVTKPSEGDAKAETQAVWRAMRWKKMVFWYDSMGDFMRFNGDLIYIYSHISHLIRFHDGWMGIW